ncbi:MAG TPA: hypothetical protein VII24_12765 [Pseudolabrys sp.]
MRCDEITGEEQHEPADVVSEKYNLDLFLTLVSPFNHPGSGRRFRRGASRGLSRRLNVRLDDQPAGMVIIDHHATMA